MWTNRENEFSPRLYVLEDVFEQIATIRRIIGYPRNSKHFNGAGLGRKHKCRTRNRSAVMAARRANVARIRGVRA